MAASAALNLTAVAPSPAPRGVRARLDSVDLLRGLVMVIMALDHTRDYFTSARFDPTDLSQTSPALFLTRWVTHFCAPVFVFLAGTSAYLWQARGRHRPALARFLVTRGLWLILLELTIIRLAWTFELDYTRALFVQVIWALGCSMIVLAGLIYLPVRAVAAVGVGMIVLHNAFDGVTPQALGGWGPLWIVLHVQAAVRLPGGVPLLVGYPLVPWIGVMAAGYALGPVLRYSAKERRRLLARWGLGLTAAFVLLRGVNLYGDPHPWSAQSSPLLTGLSFLNTTKYPPSLLFLLMTLGPALLALVAFEHREGRLSRLFIVFGRVPLFFYVIHIFVIHGLALGLGVALGYPARQFIGLPFFGLGSGWGFGLPIVYLVWAGVVLALYPACRWFAEVKARRRDAWLSYL